MLKATAVITIVEYADKMPEGATEEELLQAFEDDVTQHLAEILMPDAQITFESKMEEV